MEYLAPSQYNPYDKFVLVETDLGIHILSGEQGGYLSGSSWRLSTPIVKVEEETCQELFVRTRSGSSYVILKDVEAKYGFTTLMADVFSSFADKAELEGSMFCSIDEDLFDETLDKLRKL